ncbi:MAG: YbaK/EbsC family protein [Dehalococcoidia bacterium]|nr:YbaK/EbsC family protein [Dehalococcoidia bacterium]
MPDESDVVRVLDAIGVWYEMVECDPEYADTAAFCERYGFPPEQSGNTIVVASKRGEKKYSACIALAHTRLDVNHSVRDLMEVKRLSFASADETAALTGMMIGGVTPFCLPDDLPVYVDSRIMTLDYVILGGGSRSAKVKIDPEVFNRMPTATVVEGLAN